MFARLRANALGELMRAIKIGLSVATLVMCLGSHEAFAGRRFFGGGFGGESLVLVKELPDIEALHRPVGKYVDLGYKFNRLSGGEWVGYIGSTRTYLPLTEPQLSILIAVGGLDTLPPVPSRPVSSFLFIGLFCFGVLVILLGLGRKLMRFLGGSRTRASSAASELRPEVLAKMMEAAAKHHQPFAGSAYAQTAPGRPVAFGKRV